ncbi:MULTISPECIES: TOPRIM nucleotidyl transferase/hydrolase domain-containing protein [unclassified Agromyces]|uniref:TOPRIM nucleotidyl transferase/hydrolase domain-containing protein n=1 Tax=unclassified Agromyces TaxID=2639701 RepID=UPI0030148724
MRDAATTTSGAVVLVEGESDHRAVLALASRLRVDLGAAGVRVAAMGGVTNMRHCIGALDAELPAPRVLGLFDVGEFDVVRRMLDESGRGRPADLAEAEALGFFACSLDLEDELIRAAGPATVEAVLSEAGELARFRAFQGQVLQRDRPVEAQLRRFAGTAGGRKAWFGAAVIDRMPLDRAPAGILSLLREAVRS